jgi:hypothetical protein
MTTLFWSDPDSGETEILVFDAIVSLSPEDSVTITDHPVEQGSNITDHARDEPERLSIEGIVSTVPNVAVDDDAELSSLDFEVAARPAAGTRTIALEVPSPPIQPDPNGLLQAGISALGNALSGGPKATVNDTSETRVFARSARALQQRSPRNRIRDVYEKLLSAKTKHVLITVQTTVRDYFDMQIERIAAPQSTSGGQSVTFQLDLRRIRVADSETVESPKPAEARGALQKNRGTQNPKNDPNGEDKAELRSIIHQGLGLTG